MFWQMFYFTCNNGLTLELLYCDVNIVDADGRKMTDAEPSPVWVPDSEAPKCMHCLKSEFTVINRRVTMTLLIISVVWMIILLTSEIRG